MQLKPKFYNNLRTLITSWEGWLKVKIPEDRLSLKRLDFDWNNQGRCGAADAVCRVLQEVARGYGGRMGGRPLGEPCHPDLHRRAGHLQDHAPRHAGVAAKGGGLYRGNALYRCITAVISPKPA